MESVGVGGALHGDGGDGNGNSHQGSARVGFNAQVPAQVAHAFAHTGKPHAGSDSIAPVAFQYFGSDAFSGILDGQRDAITHAFAANRGSRAAGVTVNVGEAFLEDAEEGQFQVLGEAIRKRDFHVDL